MSTRMSEKSASQQMAPSDLGGELYGYGQCVAGLMQTFRAPILFTCPSFQAFLSAVAQLTQESLRQMATEVDDDAWFMETFEIFLDMWTSFSAQIEAMATEGGNDPALHHFRHATLPNLAFDLFKNYIQARMTMAECADDEDSADLDGYKDYVGPSPTNETPVSSLPF